MSISINLKENSPKLADMLNGFLSQRRRQLQDWEANPPHRLGWILFTLVSIELTLSSHLFYGLGLSSKMIGQFISVALSLLMIQGVAARMTQEVSEYHGKNGDWKKTFTFFNLSLYPLLIMLPINLTLWSLHATPIVRALIFLALGLKVLGNWKESAEITHELSRFQAIFVIYATIGLFVFFYAMIFYVGLILQVSELTQMLS